MPQDASTRSSTRSAVDVIRLGALTTEAIAAGTQALLDGDLAGAEHVVEGDDRDRRPLPPDRGPVLLAPRPPAADGHRPPDARHDDADQPRARAQRRPHGERREDDPAPLPDQLDPKVRGIIDQMGVQASNQTRLAIDAFADSDPSWAARARRHGRHDGRAHQEPVPPHPVAGARRRGHRAAGGAGRARRPALRADRRPRGHDRRAGPVHGDRRAPRAPMDAAGYAADASVGSSPSS